MVYASTNFGNVVDLQPMGKSHFILLAVLSPTTTSYALGKYVFGVWIGWPLLLHFKKGGGHGEENLKKEEICQQNGNLLYNVYANLSQYMQIHIIR